MLPNRYFKYRSQHAWENYRKSRNKVSKLKAVSMYSYYKTWCNKHNLTNNPLEYLNTIKPFMTDKYKSKGSAIAILKMTSLKVNRLLPIYISIVPLKFEVDIQSQSKIRVWKPKNPIWLPGGHFESDIADNQ